MSWPRQADNPPPPSSAGGEFLALSAAHLVDGVKGAGSKITAVGTPWAITGNRVSCVYTPESSTDGIPEGYTWAVLADALLSDLGVTAAELLNGAKSLIVAMRVGTAPGAGANIGVALATSSDESGDVATLSGGGVGFRAHGSQDTIAPMAFDSTQESAGFTFTARATACPVGRLECYDGYWRARASLQVDGRDDLEGDRDNASGFASRTDPIWLVIWGGGATANEITADVGLWFAVTDGPGFEPVPAFE